MGSEAAPEEDVLVVEAAIEASQALTDIDQVDFEVNQAEAITYQRADGTIERAVNVEDAIKRCPVLGKLPLEQANVLLELVAVGKEKIDIQAHQRDDHQKNSLKGELIQEAKKTTDDKTLKTNISTEPTPHATASEMHPIKPDELMVFQIAEDMRHHEGVTGERLRSKRPLVIDTQDNLTKPRETPNAQLISDGGQPAVRAKQSAIKHVEEFQLIPDTASLDIENDETQPKKIIFEKETAIETQHVVREVIEMIDESPSAEGYPSESSDNEILPPEDHSQAEAVSAVAEVITDEDGMETYTQLVTLGDALQHGVVQHETEEDNTFENFIDSQVLPEQPDSLESIALHINEQPFEETLVQLVSYLSEVIVATDDTVDTSESTDSKVIVRLLQEIEAELVKPSIDGLDNIEALQLTPEITQKLLALLRAVGYENPQDVLVGFVLRHNIEFLLQAIRYLYQLTNEDMQQEFLFHKTLAPLLATTGDPVALRLGKALIKLIKAGQETVELTIV